MNKKRGHDTVGPAQNRVGTAFAAYAGTFPGREHLRRAQNNQDGFALFEAEDLQVAVVTDGCGSSPQSEIGAQLGAAWLAAQLPRLWRGAARTATAAEGPRGASGPVGLEELAAFAQRANAELAGAMAAALGVLEPGPLSAATLARFGLFTWLAAILDDERWAVVGLGDGAYAVDGALTLLASGTDNAPDYAAYRLIDPALLSGRPRLEGEVFACGLTRTLDSLVVATDGLHHLPGAPADALATLALDAPPLKNPSLLQKRLRAASTRDGAFPDDTTLAVLRRRHP